MHDLTTRIKTSLTTIHHKFKKGNILVITHGGVIDVLWRLANNIKPESIERPIIRNGSIHQLIYNPDSKEIFIENFNKTNHLDRIAALDDL
jgi:broad specificity phosphatase PhoE